jgi:peptide/nickel transport system ATP-binding protein
MPEAREYAPSAYVQSDFVQLAATDVTKVFGRRRSQRHTAVDRVSLTVESGRAVGIVGESGSGKSTLARILAGIEVPTTGTVYFNDAPIASQLSGKAERLNLRRHVQMVSQDTSSSFDPLKTLRASVRTPAMRLLGLGREQADAEVDRVTAGLELPTALADRYPQHVSGGQRQRFALARALIVRPRLLICDEVVSALDVSVQGSVLNILRGFCAESGAGLVFVSHGLPATAFISDRIAVMRHGQIVEDGPTGEVLGQPSHEYSRQLLAAYRGAPVLRDAS